MLRNAHRLGAAFYVLWGIAHVAGGALMWSALSAGGAPAYLANVATAVPAAELSQAISPAGAAVLAFHAFNLCWLGALVIAIAVTLNWRNSVAGYWINLAVVTTTDVGLIVTTLIPGYMNVSDGLIGPILWLFAAAFTTVGVLRATDSATSAALAPSRV